MIKRTSERRNDLILFKDLKNIPVSKRIKVDKNDSVRSLIGNEYDNYPDW